MDRQGGEGVFSSSSVKLRLPMSSDSQTNVTCTLHRQRIIRADRITFELGI